MHCNSEKVSYFPACREFINQNSDDYLAREKMSYVSMLMGMNRYNVGNCLPHRMQYPIGALTGTSHVAGLATFHPRWIKTEYQASLDSVMDIFETLMKKFTHDVSEAVTMMTDFQKELGVYRDLIELGIKEEKIPVLLKKISGDLSTDLIGKETELFVGLYGEALVNFRKRKTPAKA